MKVLLNSYSAACRGSYGIATREIWMRILERCPDIEVVQHGWFHYKPQEEVPWKIIPTNCPTVFPDKDGRIKGEGDIYGEETIEDVIKEVKPDLVWDLEDPWMNTKVAMLKRVYNYKLIYYCPVDGEPYPPRFGGRIAAADTVVAMSNYGAKVLKNLPQMRERDVPVIYLGYDQHIFNQATKEERKIIRHQLSNGMLNNNDFVLGWVGKDQFRKQVWVLYALMHYLRSGEYIICKDCNRITHKEYDPDNRKTRDPQTNVLYDTNYNYDYCWHCKSRSIVNGLPRKNVYLWAHMVNKPQTGYDLLHLAEIYKVGDIIHVPDRMDEQGVEAAEIAGLYNGFDAMVYPTGGEGFSMVALEANACGVPLIYSNYSAHAEFATGLPVKCNIFPEIKSQRFRAICVMDDLIKQTLTMINDTNTRHILSKRAIKSASKMTWDATIDQWLKIIKSTMETETANAFGRVI